MQWQCPAAEDSRNGLVGRQEYAAAPASITEGVGVTNHPRPEAGAAKQRRQCKGVETRGVAAMQRLREAVENSGGNHVVR